MAEVKLIGSPLSFYCWRVAMVLKMKGVDYEYILEDPRNKSPLLLKYNPIHKKIPVLLHGGNPIAESLVIIEYIHETWKENPIILSEDPYERAIARFWAKFTDEKVIPGVWAAFSTRGEAREKATESAIELLKTVDQELKGKKFFGGEAIGYLDIVMGLIPCWLPIWEEVLGMKLVDAETFPSLHAWVENFLEVPIIKESLPPRDEMLHIFRQYISPSTATK
ncbi:probable glutathione S-transferase [Magnolia sinica]|uniref:probable glutathione S-transferase n=1 Tax=Magnolia sinica TaxID=86752 RepID=UPI00265A2244|nr:probable glutathione S-transferase [Magnolia sinica]